MSMSLPVKFVEATGALSAPIGSLAESATNDGSGSEADPKSTDPTSCDATPNPGADAWPNGLESAPPKTDEPVANGSFAAGALSSFVVKGSSDAAAGSEACADESAESSTTNGLFSTAMSCEELVGDGKFGGRVGVGVLIEIQNRGRSGGDVVGKFEDAVGIFLFFADLRGILNRGGRGFVELEIGVGIAEQGKAAVAGKIEPAAGAGRAAAAENEVLFGAELDIGAFDVGIVEQGQAAVAAKMQEIVVGLNAVVGQVDGRRSRGAGGRVFDERGRGVGQRSRIVGELEVVVGKFEIVVGELEVVVGKFKIVVGEFEVVVFLNVQSALVADADGGVFNEGVERGGVGEHGRAFFVVFGAQQVVRGGRGTLFNRFGQERFDVFFAEFPHAAVAKSAEFALLAKSVDVARVHIQHFSGFFKGIVHSNVPN